MPTIKQISRQDRADQGFRVDCGRGNTLRRAEPAPSFPVVRPKPGTPVVTTIAALEQDACRQKRKVAAYCRVSTLMESQEGSIISQRRHFIERIESNPGWEPAGIYLEAGVSGARAEIRPELQRLLADCRAGRVQMILTKSISRFTRNTSDCLEMVIDCFRAGHRAKKNALAAQEKELLQEKLSLTTRVSTSAQAEKLKGFIARWQITDRTGDFPDEAFMDLVERAVAGSKESVTFYFKCGMAFTESLRRMNG